MSTPPKINTLKIKNFGCIGPKGITIDIDRIVVLVGANNAGKSTILRAFEAIADCLKLEVDDFHNRQISKDDPPEIEVHSIANSENKPGDEWCLPYEDNQFLIREKWTWENINTEPARIGYNKDLNRWAKKGDKETMPWGMNNLAKSRRPKPHRVNTFDDPDVQAKAITSLLKSILEDNIRNLKAADGDELSRYDTLIQSLIDLRNECKTSQQSGIENLQLQANKILEKIFPNHSLTVVSQQNTSEISVNLLGEEFGIEIGPIGGTSLPLAKQGSGTRRTALWTILKLLADQGYKAKNSAKTAKSFHEPLGPNASHILLLDEPEVSLHPRAIQNARDVLYALTDSGNWQVMITTHSPSFVDLTKDNTTIIRVEKNNTNDVETVTLYRPDKTKLDDDDKENLKLINLFDSHISEAFFGGKILVVEGDTEYTAFNYIKAEEEKNGNNTFNELNVIRARGKVTVASMMKVLNHFQSRYFVLHDTDRPTTTAKRRDKTQSTATHTVYFKYTMANPAWTNNEKILNQMSENSRVVASTVNFEEAYFSEVVDSDKPENCITHLKTDASAYLTVKKLLEGILEINGADLPKGAIAWKTMEELGDCVAKWDAENPILPAGA